MLRKIIRDAGGLAAVAKEMTRISGERVTPQRLSAWETRKKVPIEMIWPFCFATKHEPWAIRPDVFVPPEVYWAKCQELKAVINQHS